MDDRVYSAMPVMPSLIVMGAQTMNAKTIHFHSTMIPLMNGSDYSTQPQPYGNPEGSIIQFQAYKRKLAGPKASYQTLWQYKPKALHDHHHLELIPTRRTLRLL